MRARASLRKPAIITRRVISHLVRAAAITSMAFAVAFGFLSGATSPGANYDPQAFAIGVAALFGAACGAIGILLSRIRQMKAELRGLEARLDQAEDRNWEIREAQERAQSFFEAQGDVIVRRDRGGTITYANDAFCAFAGRSCRRLCLADRDRIPSCRKVGNRDVEARAVDVFAVCVGVRTRPGDGHKRRLLAMREIAADGDPSAARGAGFIEGAGCDGR